MKKKRDPIDIRHGDVIRKLREMPDKSVHMVVTSPPYYKLRIYGIPPSVWVLDVMSAACPHEFPEPAAKTVRGKVGEFSTIDGDQERGGQRPQVIDQGSFCAICGAWRGCHGLEPTLELYVKHEVLIWREVKRVLRDDGTVWLDLGDSYASDGSRMGNRGGNIGKHRDFERPTRTGVVTGFKNKDMMGVPWRVAFALQDDGWYLRSDIVWHKPNPMPGSQSDRPTSSHEFVFLLSKSENYFYDQYAVQEPASTNTHARSKAASMFPSEELREEGAGRRRKPNGWHSATNYHGANPDRPKGVNPKAHAKKIGETKANGSFSAAVKDVLPMRNLRDVWTIPTQSYKGAHYATFPEALVRPCVLAGTSAKGCCRKCGASWRRVVQKSEASHASESNTKYEKGAAAGRLAKLRDAARANGEEYGQSAKTTDWCPTCSCDGIDRRIIASPIGSEDEYENPDDLTLTEGRAGMGRERDSCEGVRWITRHEQAEYGRQIKALGIGSTTLLAMEEDAGKDAFAHYLRTDESGARAIPPKLLESWIAKGRLTRVEVPPHKDVPVDPCIVLDIFAGSGTTGKVCAELGRDAILIEIKDDHVKQIKKRTTTTPQLPGFIP